MVQDINGFLKVPNPKLGASDHFLVLLYQRGGEGVMFEEQEPWARAPMPAT